MVVLQLPQGFNILPVPGIAIGSEECKDDGDVRAFFPGFMFWWASLDRVSKS